MRVISERESLRQEDLVYLRPAQGTDSEPVSLG